MSKVDDALRGVFIAEREEAEVLSRLGHVETELRAARVKLEKAREGYREAVDNAKREIDRELDRELQGVRS